MQPFDFQSRTRLVFGEGSFQQLGALARELGFRRTLMVADRGILACGYCDEASKLLTESGITISTFHDFDSNPNTVMIEAGRDFAATLDIDSIIGLGGGSSMDTAKAINFLLTSGGAIEDYWGYGRSRAPMLPMIGIPTTSGTGSEAQSYALISDARTHVKMACGDPGAAFKIAILDPRLTVTQPAGVTAAAGFDAISHSVETYVTKKRTPASEKLSLEAWRLLAPNYERVISNPDDLEARGAMQLGAYWAGLAIENSMLGAAHACANPLTANYDTEHGVAIGLMLPHVVRWNGAVVGERYGELLNYGHEFVVRPSGGSSYGPADRLTSYELPPEGRTTNGGDESHPGEALARRLEDLIRIGRLPRGLKSVGVPEGDLPRLAVEAASQWTGQHNPRRFGEAEALELYKCAYESVTGDASS
jgi:alcohol dehydrogenase class IV